MTSILAGGYIEQADGTGQTLGTDKVLKYDVDKNYLEFYASIARNTRGWGLSTSEWETALRRWSSVFRYQGVQSSSNSQVFLINENERRENKVSKLLNLEQCCEGRLGYQLSR